MSAAVRRCHAAQNVCYFYQLYIQYTVNRLVDRYLNTHDSWNSTGLLMIQWIPPLCRSGMVNWRGIFHSWAEICLEPFNTTVHITRANSSSLSPLSLLYNHETAAETKLLREVSRFWASEAVRACRLPPALSLYFSLSPVNFWLMLVIWQLTRQLLLSISHVCMNKEAFTHTHIHTHKHTVDQSWATPGIYINAPSSHTLCEWQEAHGNMQTTHSAGSPMGAWWWVWSN